VAYFFGPPYVLEITQQ